MAAPHRPSEMPVAAETELFPLRPSRSVTLSEAMRDYKLWFAVPLVVLLCAAAAVGLLRSPVYTAQARLSVGGTDLTRPSVLAAGGAAEALSAVLSRSLTADPVLESISKKVDVPTSNIQADLVGSPIPDTNLILIDASSGSDSDAVRLANAASLSVIGFINRLNGTNQHQVEARLKAAVLDLAKKQKVNDADPSAKRRADVHIAQLRKDSLEAAYRTSLNSEQAVLRVFDPAGRATSDRVSKLELLLFIGLAVGLILGAALALWRARSDAAALANREGPRSPRRSRSHG